MKAVAVPIFATVLTGSFGYWVAVEAIPLPERKPAAVVSAKPAVVHTPTKRSHVPSPASFKKQAKTDWHAILASDVEPGDAQPVTEPTFDGPLEGYEIVSVEDDIRFVPTTRPSVPVPQRPPLSNEENVDTGKPVHEWQRLTDDWFGVRPRLDDRGISIQASITTDWSKVLAGGIDTNGDAFRNLFNFNVTLDTERLFKWHGGTLFVGFQNQAGDDGAADVGDLQGISNIDADGRTQVSELWYEQLLLDGKLRVKVGKVDANADFNHVANADEFINGAFGAAPTILGFPTYPDPATSINVFVNPCEHAYVGFGVYDGTTQVGQATGNYGPANAFDGTLFYIAETGLTWTTACGLDGVLSVGAWHHTGDFERFDGNTDNSATGQYAMLNHQLWRENAGEDADGQQGIGMFAKYGYADGDVSAIEHHLSGGVVWTGAIPHRDDDVIGLGVNYAWLSDEGDFEHANETVYELFYRARLNAWLSVKPDLQYIHNAADGGARDTLVGMVRVVIDF